MLSLPQALPILDMECPFCSLCPRNARLDSRRGCLCWLLLRNSQSIISGGRAGQHKQMLYSIGHRLEGIKKAPAKPCSRQELLAGAYYLLWRSLLRSIVSSRGTCIQYRRARNFTSESETVLVRAVSLLAQVASGRKVYILVMNTSTQLLRKSYSSTVIPSSSVTSMDSSIFPILRLMV